MKRYLSPPVFAILALGFSSGLPLALTAATLSIWLTESGVDKTTIGLFAAVALPYSFKFLWAPVVDALPFPVLTRLLGKRRGWLVGAQMMLAGAIVLLGFADPAADATVTALAALLVAFCSATQDIVVDAFRVESLPAEQQGTATAMYTLGYRLAMIISGAGALYLATYFGWHVTYMAMASLTGIGMVTALLSKEPTHPAVKAKKQFFRDAVVAPMADFVGRPMWLAILCFTAFYKLPDAFIGLMSNPFLLEVGYVKTDIADVAKLYGLIATIAGGFLGGWLVTRFGLVRILLIAGIGQGVTNLLYVWLAGSAPSIAMLATVVTIDNLVGGASSVAFVAYLSALCNQRFTATQYALLSSLATFGRTLLATPAGWAAEHFGWPVFFASSALLVAPGMVLLALITRRAPKH